MWFLLYLKFLNFYEVMKYFFFMFKNRFMEKDVMKGRVMEYIVGVVFL